MFWQQSVVSDPSCAGCHNLVDPPGFAFEYFDGDGRYQATENGFSIDASGAYQGVEFVGHVELLEILSSLWDFDRALSRHIIEHVEGGVLPQDCSEAPLFIEGYLELQNASIRSAITQVALGEWTSDTQPVDSPPRPIDDILSPDGEPPPTGEDPERPTAGQPTNHTECR
jgi:hypothetical protein